MNQTTKDTCDICKTKYFAKTENVSDGRCCGYIYNSCPKCGYDPLTGNKIYTLIEDKLKIEMTVSQNNRGVNLRINTQELTDLITAEIKRKWPKNTAQGGKTK